MVIGADHEKQMAPYQQNNMDDCPKEHLKFNEDEDCDFDEEAGKKGYWENPNAKWDWYQVGGRRTGFFKLKNGKVGKLGSPGLMTKEGKPGYADQATKKDIDFQGMYDEAHKKAKGLYHLVRDVIGADPDHKVWKSFVERVEAKELTIEQAREDFWAQPLCAKWRQNREKLSAAGWSGSPDDFEVDKEEYCEQAAAGSLMTYAYLKDGVWCGRGDMGWFGMSLNDMDEKAWGKQFIAMLDELPDDTLFTIIDCHI